MPSPHPETLPDGWQIVPVSEVIARLEVGVSVNGEDRPAARGEVGVLRLNAVSNGRFIPDENKVVVPADRTRVAVSPRRGDVLLSRANGSLELVGASVFVEADHPELFLPDLLWRLTTDPTRNCSRWLHYALSSPTGRRSIMSKVVGSNGTHKISQASLRDIQVPRPPLAEQNRISAVLTAWDQAIELTEKLIAAKRQRKAALMQHLLTGKVRFHQFIKSPNRHHTAVGEMPVDWLAHKLAAISARVKRKNTVGENHVLTASGEHGLVDQREFFNRSVAGADLSGYYLLKRGEFAYNRSAMKGYPFGAIKRLDRYEQGVLSTLYICFGLADEKICDSDFMAHFFEARLLDRQLGEVTQVGGRAHGLLNITDADFYSLQVVLPGIEEQKRIAPVLNEQQREIELLNCKLDALRRQKTGLMQQLLTGKKRVLT